MRCTYAPAELLVVADELGDARAASADRRVVNALLVLSPARVARGAGRDAAVEVVEREAGAARAARSDLRVETLLGRRVARVAGRARLSLTLSKTLLSRGFFATCRCNQNNT